MNKIDKKILEREVIDIASSGRMFTLNYIRKATNRNYYILRPLLEDLVVKGKLEKFENYNGRVLYKIKA